jgi:hypothetical protein
LRVSTPCTGKCIPLATLLPAKISRNFYQMRVDRLRNVEIAKRNQQRMKDPNFFPSTPKGDVG